MRGEGSYPRLLCPGEGRSHRTGEHPLAINVTELANFVISIAVWSAAFLPPDDRHRFIAVEAGASQTAQIEIPLPHQPVLTGKPQPLRLLPGSEDEAIQERYSKVPPAVRTRNGPRPLFVTLVTLSKFGDGRRNPGPAPQNFPDKIRPRSSKIPCSSRLPSPRPPGPPIFSATRTVFMRFSGAVDRRGQSGRDRRPRWSRRRAVAAAGRPEDLLESPRIEPDDNLIAKDRTGTPRRPESAIISPAASRSFRHRQSRIRHRSSGGMPGPSCSRGSSPSCRPLHACHGWEYRKSPI